MATTKPKRLQLLGHISSIDDTKVGDQSWSSKNTVDKLCPAFAKTGSVVACEPVEGYPLEVVSYLADTNPDLLSWVEPTVIYRPDSFMVEDYGMQIEVPAGEYILTAKSDGDVSVKARGTTSNEWLSLGDVPMESGEGELTFTHNGGLLRVCGDFMSEDLSATLHKTIDPKAFTSVILRHNDQILTAEFPEAVKDGHFNWSTGILSTSKGNPNLIPVDLTDKSNWMIVDSDDFLWEGHLCYIIQDLPSGDYTIFAGDSTIQVDAYNVESTSWENIDWAAYDMSSTFHHNGGTIRLLNHDNVAVVVKLEEGTEYTGIDQTTYQLTPHTILGLPGENTLQSISGNTKVSCRLDPIPIIDNLLTRMAALEAAVVNNV